MPLSIETSSTFFADAPAHRVYYRLAWSDPWSELPYLYASEIEFVAAPAISRARLVWDYGIAMRAGETEFAEVDPLEFTQSYIKIEIDQPADSGGAPRPPLEWFGRAQEMVRDRTGEITDSGLTAKTGRLEFECAGLEAELLRAYVTSSIVENPEGVGGGVPTQKIGRAVAFNRAKGYKCETAYTIRGNMSKAPQDKGARVFAGTLDNAEVWTASEIIRYLLAYHTPTDPYGVPNIPWELDDTQLETLDWAKPPLDVHGRNLKEILDTLIDRRRLVSYTVRVEPDGDGGPDRAIVRVFTFLDSPLTLPDGTVIYPNPAKRELWIDTANDVQSCVTRQSALHKVDRVRVVGDFIGSCFTISAKDATLVADWENTDEVKYETAASGDPGYGPDRADKELQNERVRLGNALRRVYRYFCLPANFIGLSGDGEGLSSGYFILPKIPPDGRPFAEIAVRGELEPFWLAGMRFEPHLPLKLNWDYSGTKIGDGKPTDNSPPGSDPEFLQPFVLLKLPNTEEKDSDGAALTRYEQLDNLNRMARFERAAAGGRQWSANTAMQRHKAGIIVDVQHPHGCGQHVLAKADFSGRPISEVSEIEPECDWHDNLLATVYWKSDREVEIVWPADGDLDAGQDVREQRIELGPDYRLDYLPPKTVVACEKGELVRTDSGGFVRDDRDKMKNLARLAYAWYRRDRLAFSLVYHQVAQYVFVGDLITQIGDPDNPETVSSVVTRVAIHLDEQTTTIQTDFGQLDVRNFVKPDIDSLPSHLIL